MTRARMVELKEALEQAGWEISNPVSATDIFQTSDDQITWEINNSKTQKASTLTFYLFDHLGRQTQQLSDIFYVKENTTDLKLYFEKINTPTWKSSLRFFVRSLY